MKALKIFQLLLYSISFCLSKELFVLQSSGKINCYLDGACDGSRESPLSSILEAIEGSFNENSIDTRIILLDAFYNFTDSEKATFLTRRSLFQVLFVDTLSMTKNIIITSSEDKQKAEILFHDSFFALSLKKTTLSFQNIDLSFGKNIQPSLTPSFFIKIDENGEDSSINFLNCSILMNSWPITYEENIKIFILVNNTSSVKIKFFDVNLIKKDMYILCV